MGAAIKLLIACILSGILYRLGGIGKPFNTKFRDLGCPFVLLFLVWSLFGFHLSNWWLWIIFIIASMGALSTYWDFIFNDKDNFWFHGFMCGLAGLVLVWCNVPLWILLVRIVICTIGMGLWSKFIGNDVIEESGRGVFFIL